MEYKEEKTSGFQSALWLSGCWVKVGWLTWGQPGPLEKDKDVGGGISAGTRGPESPVSARSPTSHQLCRAGRSQLGAPPGCGDFKFLVTPGSERGRDLPEATQDVGRTWIRPCSSQFSSSSCWFSHFCTLVPSRQGDQGKAGLHAKGFLHSSWNLSCQGSTFPFYRHHHWGAMRLLVLHRSLQGLETQARWPQCWAFPTFASCLLTLP